MMSVVRGRPSRGRALEGSAPKLVQIRALLARRNAQGFPDAAASPLYHPRGFPDLTSRDIWFENQLCSKESADMCRDTYCCKMSIHIANALCIRSASIISLNRAL